MINSGARETLFYEAPSGNRVNINSNEVFTTIQWATTTVVLGSTLEGIWPPCTDVTDVNSTDVSHSGQVVATGDDFGFVKLFEYPCPVILNFEFFLFRMRRVSNLTTFFIYLRVNLQNLKDMWVIVLM